MAMLKRHVVLAITLLALFALVSVIRHDSLASPNLFILQLRHCLQRSPSDGLNKVLTADPTFAVRRHLDILHPNESPEIHRPEVQTNRVTQPRVALCLVGGARAFELTAGGLRRHLIDPHENWDVFLHAPLDDDAHKFTLLQNISSLASARIFVPEALPESALHREVLYGGTSPNGVQGLLQYFKLVEGCLDMIAAHEKQRAFEYDWVVRTRVDGFWNGPLPPLSSLNSSTYYIPIGSGFGGFNDRLGMGSRNATVAALSRFSLLPLLHVLGRRRMNSEAAFQAQLEELGVACESISFPFCILSRRRYNWPLEGSAGVPVASIGTRGALNGAKCRPCTPVATGSAAREAVRKLSRSWGWPGRVRGLALCDAQGDWEPNWENAYAKAAGTRFEKQRKKVLSRSVAECEADVARFGQEWDSWDAPPAKQICSRRYSQ